MSTRLSMTTFGVEVVPKGEWPWAQVGGPGKQATCRMDTKLVTTQTHVYADIVSDLADKIRRGEETKRVELMFVRGRSWIIDGHHTLAAYRSLDRPAPCTFYGPGQDTPPPPSLFKMRKNPTATEDSDDSDLVERIDDVHAFLQHPGRYHTSSGHEAFAVVEALAWHPLVKMGEQLAFPEGTVQFFEVLDKPLKPNAAEMEGWGTESDYYERRLLNYDRWEMAWWREVIQNARDAKGPGAPSGPSKIELECTESTFTDPETNETVPAMLCVCRDNGTGMDADTLRKAFFTRGGSVKPAGSVGGFGDAKELILTPWLGYEVRSRDNLARGRHEGLYRPGIESGKPFLQGTEVRVWMPMTRATTANYASELIERCLLKGIRVTINGTKVDASLTGGTLVLDNPVRLNDGTEVGRLVIHHQSRSKRTGVYVRANGVFMFELKSSGRDSGDFKGIVYVDINAPPRRVFTTKRDQLSYDSTARDDVYSFLEELAVDPKKRLKKERAEANKIRRVYKGTGALEVRESIAAEIAASVAAKVEGKLFKTPKKAGDLVVLSDGVVDAVLAGIGANANALGIKGSGDDVDLSPSAAAADVILRNVSFMSVEQITSAIRFAAWKPDFYVYQNLDFWRMPAKLAPGTMAPKYQRLIRLYAELCKFAMAQLGEFDPFGVGWCFDTEMTDQGQETTLGLYTKFDGRSWILLNPINLRITVQDDGTEHYDDEGDAFDLSRDADIERLCTIVLHEVTHLQGFSKHGDAYARQLTDNIRVALRGMMSAAKKLLKITTTAVRGEVREAKAAKAAIKNAPWSDVIGAVLYLAYPHDRVSWDTRRDLANVTPLIGTSTNLDALLQGMAWNVVDTPELATEHIRTAWPTTHLRYGGESLDPLKPKQLVVIYDAIQRLGIALPPHEVLAELVQVLLGDNVPRDPRQRLTAPAGTGVYTWTKDGERWVLRAGYVGQRGDKIVELRNDEVGGWTSEDFETLANSKAPDASVVFTPKYRSTPKEWALRLPDGGGVLYIEQSTGDPSAYVYSFDVDSRGPYAFLQDNKLKNHPSVAEAQAAVVDALVRQGVTG